MHSAGSAKHVLSIATAGALLAGCSSTVGATGIMQSGHAISTSILDPKVALGKSDMSKSHPLRGKIDARSGTFWISDAVDDAVQIFTFPSGTYLGAAPQPPEGFSEPQGMCSDKNGNVFIANTEHRTIDEYAANGTFTRALPDPNALPASCAIDPKSGTLAVSNIFSYSYRPGGISLYKNASGKPRQLTDPNMAEVYFIAYYGRTGKLYYSGFNNSFDAVINSYVNGTFKTVALNGVTLDFPGAVAWANTTKSLIIFGQGSAGGALYHVRADGKVTGWTALCGSSYCGPAQVTVSGKYFVAPDPESEDAAVYPYPAGGDALVTVTGFGRPVGTAVSSVNN
jgi:hypothetical protein